MKKSFFLLALLLAVPLTSTAKEKYGSYQAEVLRVIDGDTIELNVHVWPQLFQRIKLRLGGINTPEKRGKNISACEKKAGQQATNFTQNWLKGIELVTVTDVHLGKYAGRALGQIWKKDESLSTSLIEAGHAKPYNGGKRKAWCNDL